MEQKQDVLNSKRFRVIYRKESFYVVVSFKEGSPYEVFAEHAVDGDISLQYMMASVDAVTRLATMGLKGGRVEKVIQQLERSSRRPVDFPGVLVGVLKKCI